MTVKELIEKLKYLDPEYDVWIEYDSGTITPATGVENDTVHKAIYILSSP